MLCKRCGGVGVVNNKICSRCNGSGMEFARAVVGHSLVTVCRVLRRFAT
jgi:DnaJ-class molecular chaperone